MRFILNIILISITIVACFIEDIYLHLWPPQTDRAIYLTIRSHDNFSFDQRTALDVKRKDALSRYTPIYRHDSQGVAASLEKFKVFMNAVSAFQEKKQKGVENLRNRLQDEFDVQLSPADIVNIVKYRDLKNLLEGVLTIEESILQNKIIRDAQGLMDKQAIEIQSPNSAGTVTHPVSDLITVEKARFLLEEKVRQLFWQVDKSVLDPVVEVSLATLQPNLEYNQTENERRLDKINRDFPSGIVEYKSGDALVPFRKVLNEKDVLLLAAYQKHKLAGIYQKAPWILFTILFMLGFYNFFLSKILADGSRSQPPYRFVQVLLITTVVLLTGYLVITPFPIYGLPFCILPMLIIFLNHGKIIATATTLVGAVLVSLISGPTYQIMLFLTFGGLAAVLVSSGLRKRLQILLPSLLVGFINTLTVTMFNMDWQALITQFISGQAFKFDNLVLAVDGALTWDIAWAVIGGLAAGPLALLLLPLLEISWATASTFKLNRYTDLNRPLMKELLSKAPGTYQHSMTVAYLSQSVGEAIGADTLLLRIAAYYHDVGKMMNPKFFIENQFNGENPHDVLEPRESARIIIKHVRHGMRIGQESGVPKIVVDLLLQHHGTQLMEYFYNIAAKTYPQSTIREEDFRYPGPKPQSVEAAILMIADAVEAASRSLQDPTRKKFEKMVRLILVKRIVDGQFSECDLTSRDLSKIVQTLVDALEASFHSRIRYPWQEKKALSQKTSWKIGAEADTVKDQDDRAFRL
ncbi:MAG: HDIG domain-containing protein [Desulfobacterales bacterium]|nr:MAG: HDIG domain-containing protein [Desulfobacterales bacterium]